MFVIFNLYGDYFNRVIFVSITSGSLLNRNSPLLTEQLTPTLSRIASNSFLAFKTMKLASFPTSIPYLSCI